MNAVQSLGELPLRVPAFDSVQVKAHPQQMMLGFRTVLAPVTEIWREARYRTRPQHHFRSPFDADSAGPVDNVTEDPVGQRSGPKSGVCFLPALTHID